jgi:hypothetical protein
MRSTSKQIGWSVLIGAFSLAGCQERPATQLFIGLATDLDAPKPLQLITMKIERAVGTSGEYLPIDNGDLSIKWPINGLPDGRYELPGSLVAFADPKDEPKIRVTVEATAAEASEGRFIRRQAVLRLVREKTLFLRMGITRVCYDNADCPDTKTCIEGRCRSPEVEATELPAYQPERKLDLSFECNSGTQFRNTTSKENLVSPTARCPSPDQICLEGTCYGKAVFGQGVSSPQRLQVEAQVTDAAGMPIDGAELRLEDGPVSLVRKLRSPASIQPADPGGTLAIAGGAPGRYAAETETSPLTTELRLTATAPGFVPEVVSIPFKPGVARYLVPVVLFPLVEQTLPAGQARSFTLEIGGRTTTLQLPSSDKEIRLRYGVVDGRFVPGQAIPAETGGLLQSVAALYLENLGQAGFPPGTEVSLGAASTAPVVGTEGEVGAYLLDLQGQWKKRSEAGASSNGRLLPSSGGFWTIANRTAKPACVRGKIVRPDGTPCPGARVRLWGPQGVSSFDSTGTDGAFCGGAAQQDAAILAVGGTTRIIYVPATPRVGAQCAQPESCTAIDPVVVDGPEGCDHPPADVAGKAAAGETCTRTSECAGLASCYEGFCVSESYLRVSMAWGVRSDFDLHLTLPGGRAINQQSREIEGVGRLDVEQCTKQCLGDRHLESVVLSAKAPDGQYLAWGENFGGAAGSTAQLEVFVAGQKLTSRMVTVPPTQDGKSEIVTFTVPPH